MITTNTGGLVTKNLAVLGDQTYLRFASIIGNQCFSKPVALLFLRQAFLGYYPKDFKGVCIQKKFYVFSQIIIVIVSIKRIKLMNCFDTIDVVYMAIYNA